MLNPSMNIYVQNILDHYKNPRNYGKIERPTVTQREANHSCGDVLELDLMIQDGKIESLQFRGQGCAISQATMSILGEEVIGMSVEKGFNISSKDIYEMLGIEISQRREKCALLSLLTLKNALALVKNSHSVSWADLQR